MTLSGGGYTSSAATLDSAGNYSITIPSFAFNTSGVVPLTATYSGDATYKLSSGQGTVTVTLSTFTLAATDIPNLTAGATSGNVSNVTVTPVAGYTGTVTLTAAVTASPAGAVRIPTFTGSSVVITDSTAKAGTITVATTAASAVRAASNRGAAWFKAAGGTAIAALLFFFLPLGSRRGRRAFSALLLVIAATFTAVGCGGGGGGGGSQKSTPGVTVSTTKNTLRHHRYHPGRRFGDRRSDRSHRHCYVDQRHLHVRSSKPDERRGHDHHPGQDLLSGNRNPERKLLRRQQLQLRLRWQRLDYHQQPRHHGRHIHCNRDWHRSRCRPHHRDRNLHPDRELTGVSGKIAPSPPRVSGHSSSGSWRLQRIIRLWSTMGIEGRSMAFPGNSNLLVWIEAAPKAKKVSCGGNG